MGATAAKMMFQCGADFRFVGMRRAVEQCGGGDDHAVQAIAALGGLHLDEGALHRVRVCLAAEPFQRDDRPALDGLHADGAGAHRTATHQYGTGAAFAETAAEFRAIEAKIVAQDIDQRRLRANVENVDFSIDVERDWRVFHAARAVGLPLERASARNNTAPGGLVPGKKLNTVIPFASF